MNIVLQRIARCDGYTIGRLYINDNYVCDTLEPQWRDYGQKTPEDKSSNDDAEIELPKASTVKAVKARHAPGTSAIPEGTYPLVVSKSRRFVCFLPLVVGVPGFEGIRIHAGNSPQDTEGCILPGFNTVPGWVTKSRRALERIMTLLNSRAPGEAARIRIERHF